jgi:hypothetical protein
MNAYLSKPIDPAALFASVEEEAAEPAAGKDAVAVLSARTGPAGPVAPLAGLLQWVPVPEGGR